MRSFRRLERRGDLCGVWTVKRRRTVVEGETAESRGGLGGAGSGSSLSAGAGRGRWFASKSRATIFAAGRSAAPRNLSRRSARLCIRLPRGDRRRPVCTVADCGATQAPAEGAPLAGAAGSQRGTPSWDSRGRLWVSSYPWDKFWLKMSTAR